MAEAGAKQGKTLYLIDGHAQFFRAYHAIRTRMSSPVTKEPTHLVFGFIGSLLKLMREYRPDYLAVVIDVSGDRESFRSEIYPEYKANRESAPDDFHPQVERCLEVLKEMEVPVIGEEGVEADDVIATIVKRLRDEHPEVNIRIVSKDKDLTQLLREGVEMFDIHQDEPVTPEKIFKTEGVKPEHVRDILALMGDTVDNVPGVQGIGPKTAAQLILQYGTIENLLAHLDEIKGKRRENLEAAKDQLPISQQLVTLKDDLDSRIELKDAIFTPDQLHVDRLNDLFRTLGFNRFQDEIQTIAGKTAKTVMEQQGGLFDTGDTNTESPTAPKRESNGDYTCITTKKQLDELIRAIRKAGVFTFDTETDGLNVLDAKLCGLAVSLSAGSGSYIPVRSPDPSKHLDEETVLAKFRPLFEDESLRKIGHNLKFDRNVLRKHGITLRGPQFDTMIASYVIDSSRPSHKMDALALGLLNHTCIPITELIGSGKNQRKFDTVPLEQASVYSAEDADVTYRLHDHFAPQLKKMGLEGLFSDVEMPLVEVLAEIEWNGIRVDPEELDRQREALAGRIEALRDEILKHAGRPFNPDSPKQLAEVLFNKEGDDPPGLGLRALKRGKTGPSTDQEVMEKLAADPSIESPIPLLIVEYRQLTKLVNTYLVALKEAIHPRTHRVHASFHQTVAATGRLSSSDPNLQNIPIRTEIGRDIRKAFIAEEGNLLIAADYSQIELRILAHLAEDEALIDAFEQDQDIHTTVAAEIHGVKPEEVTPEQRSGAKMVNFGIVYGITPWGLARRLGGNVTVKDAETIIDGYKQRFARIDAFLQSCIEHAERTGYVETILKRRRLIPQIEAKAPQLRALGERLAINSVVQGSAADLIKVAMIDLHRRLPEAFPEAKMLLQIHDELVFEAPEKQAADVEALVVERMQQAMDLRVPLKVEASRGRSWYEAK